MERGRIAFSRVCFLLTVALIAGSAGFAQEIEPQSAGEPAWLAYERGMQAFRARQYGIALLEFRTALERQPVYPEATAAIGRVYRQDGNMALAERYFLEALSRSAQLYIPEDKYRISYELADLYSLQARTKAFQDVLESVKAEHGLSADTPESRRLRASFLRVLHESGIDRLLTLYRLPIDFAYRAYAESGFHYVRTGRYNDAVRSLAVAAIQALSATVSYIRRWNLDFEYADLGSLLARIPDEEDLADFANETDLYAVLYYLGSALYGNQSVNSAVEIWTDLAETPAAGEYRRRSRMQLRSPELEPVIDF